MGRTPAAVIGAAVAGLLALSACAAKTDGAPQTAEQQPAVSVQSVRLAVAEVESLGQVVTDQNGRTLYRFDMDTAKPSVSNCNEDCAVAWPPVEVTDLNDVQVSNVNKRLVGMVERADGTKQLTLGGWALYRYRGDIKAGDVKGQGLNGTWFASTPEGKKAQAAAKPAPQTQTQTQTQPKPAPQTQKPSDPGYGY